MTFHTLSFLLVFLPIVVAIYRVVAGMVSRRAANLVLLAASGVFYAMSGVRNLPVIFVSFLGNHLIGLRVGNADDRRSRLWLITGAIFNVALLCWFKYPDFFPSAVGAPRVMGTAGLPLGVSFFTIQQIMYLMDIHEKLAAPATLLDHAQAILYFPCVTAGPITRTHEIARELYGEKTSEWTEDIGRGIVRFALGLFKKIVIADNLAVVVSAGYAAAGELGTVETLAICCCFTLQIYFDFSGYCDMAIGIGRMLGHTLPENFDNPLRATSISDFWQRWHMTLTTFITTYLFTPIVRSWGRVTTRKAMAAMIIAMAIAGVWHGSGWVFLIFGLLHGFGLAVRLAWKASKRKMSDGFGTLLTFLFVTIAFIFFRSPNLKVAGDLLVSLMGAHGIVNPASLSDNAIIIALRSNWGIPGASCVVAFGLAFLGPTSTRFAWTTRLRPQLAAGIFPLVLISLLFISSAPSKGFIYADKQPRLRTFLSSTAGFTSESSTASEKVVVGRNGWLYYSPGLTYAFGPPFLDADVLRSRATQMVEKERETEPSPDPRPALFGLIDDCRRWGIHLVLAPVPDKAMLQPLQVPARSLGADAVPDNPSFRPFVKELQEKGADVFDWRPQSVRRSDVRFLKRDTHWNPGFMEEYAARLASHVSSLVVLPFVPPGRRYSLRSERRDNPGDLASMLKLLPGIAQSETVETHPVVDAATGQPVTADTNSQLLLLGDSFTNIYSLASLGWGEHAGLAEHLAYDLNQPLDVLAMNGAATTEVRSELVRAARAGRLGGKRVLIYEFAIADLAVENWKPMHLPVPPPVSPAFANGTGKVGPGSSEISANKPNPPDSSSIPKATGPRTPARQAVEPGMPPSSSPGQSPPEGNLNVIAKIMIASRIPVPGAAPYKDCVGITKMLVSSAEDENLKDKTILVVYWVMRDDALVEAAKYKAGDTLKMTLIPFEKADASVRGTQRSDDTQDYDSPMFWATSVEAVSK